MKKIILNILFILFILWILSGAKEQAHAKMFKDVAPKTTVSVTNIKFLVETLKGEKKENALICEMPFATIFCCKMSNGVLFFKKNTAFNLRKIKFRPQSARLYISDSEESDTMMVLQLLFYFWKEILK